MEGREEGVPLCNRTPQHTCHDSHRHMFASVSQPSQPFSSVSQSSQQFTPSQPHQLAAGVRGPQQVTFPYGTPDGGAGRNRHDIFPDPICSPIAHHSPPPTTGSPVGRHHVPLSHPSPLPNPNPSPGPKHLLMGSASNARNDIYLKTLMNSPYHKSCTPISAPLGYNPTYVTPGRGNVEKGGAPGPGVTSTPQGTRPPHSGKKYVTPKNIVVNPFEVGVDDLHLPAYMSPGFFTVASTPASEQKQFTWSIEHIAELNPADIDPMPNQPTTHVVPDRETEERAQRAIDQFFASNLIAPSPWSDPKKNTKKKNVLPVTPFAQTGSGSNHTPEQITELQGSIQKSLPPKHGTEDAACQTVLTLPLTFDLQKVLSQYMTHDAHEESCQQDMLSTSSLRRKLFFHGDMSSLAPSPVKGVPDPIKTEPMSPSFAKKPGPDWDHTTPLKNTPAFSSSPIKSANTPQYRRCSSDPEFLASPELSPIVHGNLPTAPRKSRSSGIMAPQHISFNVSPVRDGDRQHSGRISPVSPIPFEGMSPESDDDAKFHAKFAESPGFSPIRPPKTPIRKALRRSQEESYIQDDICGSLSDEDGESITPISENPNHHRNPSMDILSPIHRSPHQRNSTFLPKSYSCNDLEHTAMEFETEPRPRHLQFTSAGISSMCETHDYETSDMDYPDETNLRSGSTNQDTGYQTASLQSTNPELGSLHSNLTNQFNSLPFNLTNHELPTQTSTQFPTNHERLPVLNTKNQPPVFSSQEFDTNSVNSSINKQLFKPEIYDDDNAMFSDCEDDVIVQPKALFSRSQSDDSALPDESINKHELALNKLDSDIRKSDPDFLPHHEEAVLSRARQVLAMANSLYPQDGMCGVDLNVTSEMVSQLEPLVASTPQKQLRQLVGEKYDSQKPSASDLAYTILQRAGEDLAKYRSIMAGQLLDVAPDTQH